MIQRLLSSSVLRLFSTAVIDQAMLSAANFLIALLLIRYAELADYGYFVLVQVSIALAVSAQGAFLGSPLSVSGPKCDPLVRDQMIAKVEKARGWFMRRFIPVSALIPVAGWALGWWGERAMWLGLAGLLAGWATLARNFLRTALLIQSRPRTMLGVDAVYVGVLLVTMGVALVLPGETAIWAVLSLAISSALGMLWSQRTLKLPKELGEAPEVVNVWVDIRRLGIWSTFGAVIYWIQSQSFNYLLAARLTVDAVAHVNAARLLMMPVFLVLTGISSLLLPTTTAWLHKDGFAGVLRRLWMFEIALIAMILGYVGVLWVARDWITVVVMNKEIADRDLLILLWAVHAAFSMTHAIFQVLLLALHQFKQTAWLSAFAAISTLTIMWFAVNEFGGPGAIIATASGEIIYLTGLVFLIRKAKKAYVAEAKASA